MAATTSGAYIRNTTDVKKYLGINSRFTLCASCPHAAWEATETEKDDNSSATLHGIERFSPMVTGETADGWIHAACYCTARGRYVPLPITYCQSYEQAMAEMNA